MRNPKLRENGYALSRDLTPTLVRVDKLKPLGRQTRRHPRRQLDKLAASLKEFGFVIPILTDPDGQVVGGWGLVLAARQLGLTQVPAVTITDLTEAKLRLLRLALNRLGEDSNWDAGALTLEFADVFELNADLDLRISGFELAEIEPRLPAAADDDNNDDDEIPVIDQRSPPVSKPGDIWVLDQHRIVCGDPLLGETYDLLLEGEAAQLVFADTYNLPIAEQVDGPARTMQSGIAMPSGKMSSSQCEAVLATAFGHVAYHAGDGSLHLIFVHWRHVKELLGATTRLNTELKDLCVWNKSAAGTGPLYGSKHELIFVFKKGSAPHINNIEYDAVGRCRGNVWNYATKITKINAAKTKSPRHPTVKPVALIADAMRDCSDLNGLVLDPFGGVGTTLIAAEKTGRRARLIEIAPHLVDCTVRRWQQLTGKAAVHRKTHQPFGAKDGPDTESNETAREAARSTMGADDER